MGFYYQLGYYYYLIVRMCYFPGFEVGFLIDIIFLLFLSELVAKCLPNQAQFKVFPTLNLDELPSNVVITSTDGEIQQICLQELLTWVKNPGGDSKEKRRRSKSHNKNIGMKASLNAIWKALIVEKDEKKAKAAIAKAKKNYGVEVLAVVYAEKLPTYGVKQQRNKVSRFLSRHGVGYG